jgi:hypothetical protein
MKKIIAAVLAIVAAVSAISLTACNKGANNAPAQSSSEAAQTSAETVDLSGLTPYGLNSNGKPTRYYKNEYDDKNRLIRN